MLECLLIGPASYLLCWIGNVGRLDLLRVGDICAECALEGGKGFRSIFIFVIFIHGKIKDIWDTRLLINN